MASFNKVILVGNVTRDIIVRYTPNGVPVTEIGIAVNDKRKDASGNWVDEVLFVDVTCWGKQAEVANEMLAKGSSVLVEGRLKMDQWTDREGQKKAKLKVVSDRWSVLSHKGDRHTTDRNQKHAPTADATPAGTDGCPF